MTLYKPFGAKTILSLLGILKIIFAMDSDDQLVLEKFYAHEKDPQTKPNPFHDCISCQIF